MKWRGLVRTANDPEVYVATPAEVKLRLGVDEFDFTWDTMLESFIAVSQRWIEDQLGIELIDSTWTLTMDCLPTRRGPWWDGVREGAVTELHSAADTIELPRWPLQSVTSITFYDDEDNPTVVDSAIYYVDTATRPGRAVLRYGEVWPTIVLRPAAGVEAAFVAGYGDAASAVPEPLKEAVRMMVAYLFEHRGECDAPMAYTKSGAATLANNYRTRRPMA